MASYCCMTCCTPGGNENFLMCSGLCKCVAHYKCAGLRKNAFDLICNSDNIFWFCDKCKDIYKVHVNSLIELVGTIKNIDDYVKKMEEQAQALTSDPVEPVTLPVTSHRFVVAPGHIIADDFPDSTASALPVAAKSEIFGTNIIGVNSCAESFKPVSNNSYVSGGTFAEVVSSAVISSAVSTSANANNIDISCGPTVNKKSLPSSRTIQRNIRNFNIRGTNTSPDIYIKTIAPKCWLHLSRFDTLTTEDDIVALANKCLGASVYKAVKLIPKDKDIHELEYVCFKLGINVELHDRALNSDAWPTGVFIRPFHKQNFRTGASNVKFRIPAAVVNSAEI